ncbi:TIGR02452 family protein [Deinococcus maricopensis]|uniref:Microbial-type PARG catalytic domain-containing protein n=1 Tax=Deinococcus maricopensis (strain DSM 21211 / LMG 22137 / NRRL B-23946 / LB-34) TaxID=709986 RepID=E8UB92_DEIML|nr:TIGR02452 family protein [Deinococcus maricopensis]ADV68331.1 Conserved hypothetical protein CHP02452 [Deinococcus maricopensis DSM 21211]
MNRSQRAHTAQETLHILDTGTFTLGERTVDVRAELVAARAGTVLYRPQDEAVLATALRDAPRGRTLVEVTNETTLAGVRALAVGADGEVGALNFASAKNPGGGFIGGSQAQEESLARATGLYHALTGPVAEAYYTANRACGTALYTDHVLYSPGVPVFRDDADALRADVVRAAFVTAPAPNAGAVARNEPERAGEVTAVLRARAARVLGAFARHGHRRIVLGAWGCGVFRNDPRVVAGVFRALLDNEARGVFEQVRFAVLDAAPGAPTWRSFQEVLDG